MPKRETLDSSSLFVEFNNLICEDTLKMELGSIVLLCGFSEVGKSFLALKTCANALNDGLKAFFWSIEDNKKALQARIKNIQSFYPFEAKELEFSTDLPELNANLTPSNNLAKELGTLSDCNLIVLDTFSAFFSRFGFKDQNNQNDVQDFFNTLTNIATSNNQAILLLHHLDKKGESIIGSSVIRNVPRIIYELDFAKGENKDTTTYRIVRVEKDSNNINENEREKSIKILANSNIDENLLKKEQNLSSTELVEQVKEQSDTELASMYNNGYITMHENRGVFYLSSKKLADTALYKDFVKNNRMIEFKMEHKDSGSVYAVNLKNDLLTQTHRGIIDALFLYVKDNVDNATIKKYQDEFWDMEILLEPYKFLKNYLGKNPSNYRWLKEKFEEISRFSYDLTYIQHIDGKEIKKTERDRDILYFDSIEKIAKDNGRVVAMFKLTIRKEYIRRLNTESTLSYDRTLAKTLINLKSLVVQDLIRFLSSFPNNSNIQLSFKEFCKIKAYADYKDKAIISKQKQELIAAKDELIKFGINVYGKNSPLKDYDDKFLHNKFADSNDLIFKFSGSENIKRFIKKVDPMNKLNIKANRFVSNSLFDEDDLK